jgi:acyl-CoA synthetase (AMP-forming)/AMP-acid ligase II
LPAAERRVAVVGSNHPAYVVAYFASQCLGASTVEMGQHESLEKLLDGVRRTRAGVVVTDRDDLREALRGEVPTDSFADLLAACGTAPDRAPEASPPPAPRDGSEEASIIFTSGTTGTPKGVVLSQGNFHFVVSAIIDYLALGPEDRYALMLPLHHTYGKTVLLSSLAVGAVVVLMDDFQNLPAFLGTLADRRCTVLSLVPYHVHVLLKWGNLSRVDLSSLRAITSSANKLPPSAIEALTEVLPQARIFSMYGLTESTTRATFVPPERLAAKMHSCGRPLSGVELKIVGEAGETLPPDRVGEVLLRGPNVMQGYFGDPELTAGTLTDGWLRTGDLGRLDEDGFLYLEGRMSEIIKCAGERIGPAEIEEVLMRHPAVAEAAVTASPDPVMGEVVHAYVLPREASLEEGTLRAYCAKELSHHKIPRRYTFVEEIPKTPTGKVRKHLLKGK